MLLRPVWVGILRMRKLFGSKKIKILGGILAILFALAILWDTFWRIPPDKVFHGTDFGGEPNNAFGLLLFVIFIFGCTLVVWWQILTGERPLDITWSHPGNQHAFLKVAPSRRSAA